MSARRAAWAYTGGVGSLMLGRRRSLERSLTWAAGLLIGCGAPPGAGRPGTRWDNAVPESFFATRKVELIYRHIWPTKRRTRTAIFEFIEGLSKRRRRHSALGYRSPVEFETAYQLEVPAA